MHIVDTSTYHLNSIPLDYLLARLDLGSGDIALPFCSNGLFI